MKASKIDQNQINEVVWKACDTFRGVVDPSEYKNYILVMLFVKYLSDLWKEKLEEAKAKYPGKPELVERYMSRQRFVLPEGSDFYSLFAKRKDDNIGEEIDVALEGIEEANKAKLEGVFRNIRFNSESNLGETKDRNKRLKNLLEDFADPRLDLRPSVVGDADVIGDVYEYLISRFASDSGKKGGEFYTPKGVATLLAKLLKPNKGAKICDPACGSGSLLIRVANEVPDPDDYALYGQESNGSTWALCRMNMFLHGKDSADIKWGDTLNNPKLLVNDSLMKFDIVVANPPFSLDKWGADEAASDPHNRFYRGVPPKSKGDFAFISHMVETSVNDTGRVGVIVPHGVLFRGAAEGRIRKAMIEENLLECVIGLPANLFFGTGIPAAILLFNRAKTTRDVLFVDAGKQYEKGTNQNLLRSEDIDRIVRTCQTFETVDKYAARVTFAEIEENEFNLNIPRYVDTFEEEEEVDIPAVQLRIEGLEGELADVRETMKGYLRDLGLIHATK
ncbi:MAG: type I restriction-modification system subunit M [Verrucomicrobia bacterium]|nr:type I restriction-modification system subunit M [Verrucomicrobiota bacterium]MCH8511538.1 type I restriction-modification system subunit M [Kiritimatiellia bacterium]